MAADEALETLPDAAADRRRGRPRLHLHPADRDRGSTPSTRARSSSGRRRASPPTGSRRRSRTKPRAKPSSPRSRRGWCAAAIALVLGTLASLAVARHRFFGRETISFLVILPIALPGIVTGVAISNTFTQVLDVPLSLFTVIVGHATFCIVVVYNNAVARLRRLSGLLRGGLGRPRRPHLADLPLRHLPGDEKRPDRRRPARLRPLLRRDHRHQLHHRRRRTDPADLDLLQPLPPPRTADRQRRRGDRDPDLDHPRLPGPPPRRRRGRHRRPRRRATSTPRPPRSRSRVLHLFLSVAMPE